MEAQEIGHGDKVRCNGAVYTVAAYWPGNPDGRDYLLTAATFGYWATRAELTKIRKAKKR